MAYAAWSVVAGEQPTAAKWNILGTNDASFNDGTGLTALNYSTLTTISNPYKFAAYRNAAQNTATSFTKVLFDSEEFDTNGNFDSVTNNRYVAPVAGFYQFNWTIAVPISGAGNDTVAALYKNGTVFKWSTENSVPGGVSGSILAQASASDFFEIFVITTSVVAMNVGATKTFFSGFLVSRT